MFTVIKFDIKQDKLENARYCLTMARKIGATVFALPEDIVEVWQLEAKKIFKKKETVIHRAVELLCRQHRKVGYLLNIRDDYFEH